jgi:hypothetical protein
MTAPAEGDPAPAEGKEPEPAGAAPSQPLLVRFAGRWLCRHDFAALSSRDDTDVQLRP